MARILIGNIKGPKGDKGATGSQGPQGIQGPQGPLPPLVNNGLATVAGVSALDAVYGKTLTDQLNKLDSNLNQKANSSELTRVSNVATAANGKVELSGGPTKIIAYAGDGNWSFQQQYGDGVILSLGMNDTQIFYDYYDGKTWTRKWTK